MSKELRGLVVSRSEIPGGKLRLRLQLRFRGEAGERETFIFKNGYFNTRDKAMSAGIKFSQKVIEHGYDVPPPK